MYEVLFLGIFFMFLSFYFYFDFFNDYLKPKKKNKLFENEKNELETLLKEFK